MVSAKDAGIIAVQTANLVVRYDAVLYPFDIPRLLEVLPEHGWIVPTVRRSEEGFSLESLPTKGKNSLRMDQGNKTIGVSGNDLSDVMQEYRELQEIAGQLGELAPEVNTDYLEFRYIGVTAGNKNPVETFGQRFSDSETLAALSEVASRYLPVPGKTMGLYGVRLTPQGVDANRRDWAELSLVPVNIYGNQYYHFDVLFRSQDVSAVESVVENAHELLQSTLRQIEA